MIALLADQDSYVYLSVLRVISQLADIDRWCVFTALLESFSDQSNVFASNSSSSSRSTATGRLSISVLKQDEQSVRGIRSIEKMEKDKEMDSENGSVRERRMDRLTLRHRSLLGEALSTVLKRAGDAAPPFVPALVSACIRIVRVRASTEEESSVEDYVNLKTMILSTTSGKEKVKDSLAIQNERESVAKKNKEKEKEEEKEQEKEGKSELEAAAHNADTVLLRQSALSLLADAVVSAKWIASKYLTDILDIATHVLTLEGREHFSQTSSVMKR